MRRVPVRPRLAAVAASVVGLFGVPALLDAADAHAIVRRVDRGNTRHAGDDRTIEVALDNGLDQGTYTVTWRVVSADGHPIREAFVFHVGRPGERSAGIATELLRGEPAAGRAPSAAAALFRFLAFASLLVLGGTVASHAFVWRDRRAWRAAPWALAVAAASTTALFALHGSIAGDLPLAQALRPSVLGDVAGTRFGAMALLRLAALATAAALLPTRRPVLLAVPTLVALATPGLAGHAGTTPPAVAWAGLALGGTALVLSLAALARGRRA